MRVWRVLLSYVFMLSEHGGATGVGVVAPQFIQKEHPAHNIVTFPTLSDQLSCYVMRYDA